jgi:hypothetical protein
MHFQIRDAKCPRCRKPVSVATIVRHPTRTDIAVRRYLCWACGPVMTKVVSLERVKRANVQPA